MTEEVLRLERHERIAILTLNRPERLNALSVELREALVDAWLAVAPPKLAQEYLASKPRRR